MIASGKDLPAAVVMGLSPTGLHVVRALGRAGVQVIGMPDGMQAGRWSRYLDRRISAVGPQDRFQALITFADTVAAGSGHRPVLIPTSDQDVEFVIAYADRLATKFGFQGSYRDGLAGQIMAKDSFYALCAAHGVACPTLWQTTCDGLMGLASDLEFPVMIKPAQIHPIKDLMRGRKGWIVRDRPGLATAAAEIPPNAGTLLVQRIIAGPESEITVYCAYVDSEGRARHQFTARKLRQYPPGFGSASLVQSHPEPETAAIAGHLLTALGYRGIAAAEFKRDPATGRYLMIEVNVRPSLWFSLSEAAGCPVVVSAYLDLAGLQDTRPERPQRHGVRWRYAAKDIWSAAFYRRNPDFVLPPPDIAVAGRPVQTVGAVWSGADPAPAIAEWINYAAKGLRRIRAGRADPTGPAG